MIHAYRRRNDGAYKCSRCPSMGRLKKEYTAEGRILYLCEPCRSEYLARKSKEQTK